MSEILTRTDRVGVQVGALEDIGDALRAHFGKKQEGTKYSHTGSDPLVIKDGGMKKLGPGNFEFIEKTGWTVNDWPDITQTMYKEYFDTSVYVGQMTEPSIKTLRIPGASKIKIKLSYSTACFGLELWNYFWMGAGLHGEPSAIQGRYFPYFYADAETGWWKTLPGHTRVCAGCGGEIVNIDGDDKVLPPYIGGDDPTSGGGWVHPCENENGEFPILHSGPILPYLEFEVEGDSLTCAWMVDFTGNAYTDPDERNYVGYYIEAVPYDANGNEVTVYQYILDEIPYSYSVGEMDEKIALLNNYPNAEEVKF